MRNKKIIVMFTSVLLVTLLAACTKDSIKTINTEGKIEQNQQVKDNSDEVESSDKVVSPAPTKDTEADKNVEEINEPDTVTKIEGRRKEFLERLYNIQVELDAMPLKEDSDAGITNAMRSYYGVAYDMYDKELNVIYALLKQELSPETMKDLQAEQIKWIQQKEAAADKAAAEYEGGTFEFVAYNVSLYEWTKERCYELVKDYMTD